MTKIRLTFTVDCDDESTATRVQEEYFSNLNEILKSSGVFGISAVWLAERETD
jgi:hypothetical protein